MYETVLGALVTIQRDVFWDSDAVTQASGLAWSISSPTFIAAFHVCRHVFGTWAHESPQHPASGKQRRHSRSLRRCQTD